MSPVQGMARFERYIGIDYSGAGMPDQRLTGIRCFEADPERMPVEVLDGDRLWSRKALYQQLTEWIGGGEGLLIGIDHGFSFPEAYYRAHELFSWREALHDFVCHWPTDQRSVESLRNEVLSMKRQGNSRWRRDCEKAAKAKSVFHFDVPGSVAKSTHAGLPWLLKLKLQFEQRLHVWPYDGLVPQLGVSVILEAYPARWLQTFGASVPPDLGADQRDAFLVANCLRQADQVGLLDRWFTYPGSRIEPRLIAREGWILGVD